MPIAHLDPDTSAGIIGGISSVLTLLVRFLWGRYIPTSKK